MNAQLEDDARSAIAQVSKPRRAADLVILASL